MIRRFLATTFALMLMCAFWFMMSPSVNAQSGSSVDATTRLTYESVENELHTTGIYTSTADYIPVCFSPCNLFFTASQPVTWTISVNGAPSISPPRKAVTATLTAGDGIYRITSSAAFNGGPTQQLEFTIQIIQDPRPAEQETTCLSTGGCMIVLKFAAPWPEGAKAILNVKTSNVLYDRYFYTGDRRAMLLMVITGETVRRLNIGIAMSNKYTYASLTHTVNIVNVKMSVKLPLILTVPVVGQ